MNDAPFRTFTEPKRSTKKWLFFPMSVVLHGILIGLIVVVPLMTAASMPEIKVLKVHIVTEPSPPPVPPAPPAKRTSSRRADKPKPKPEEQKPVEVPRFVAPIEVPDVIEEEAISDYGLDIGSDFGVEGGIEGGVPGGVLGGLASTGDMNNLKAVHITTIQKPKLIRQVAPQYPATALRARLKGTVIVEAVTDIYGRVIRVRVLTGHPLFRNAASEAVRKWQYEPYIINGIPKPVVFQVTVNFRLEGAL